ncbi:MAG: hypothetical protein QOE62_4227, partial [Actinomycetota bacterium]|nr:hypothetical protein [Actinomycetota bacterium]
MVLVGVDDGMPMVSTTGVCGSTMLPPAGLWSTTLPTLASSVRLSVDTVKPFASRAARASASVLPTSPGYCTFCAPVDT